MVLTMADIIVSRDYRKFIEERKIELSDSVTISKDMMDHFNKIGEQKWTDLIKYGIARGEFKDVDVFETVNVILYVYQGVRMWSRIVNMTSEVFASITNHIKKQLIKEW